MNAKNALSTLQATIVPLVQSLTPQDFEILIELIFANSGWIKTSQTGGNQRTTDLDLYNPITKQQIWVQVKSETNPTKFKDYVERHYAERSSFEAMYYVYHTGSHGSSDDDSIHPWDTNTVAEQVVSNGLVDWVLNKAK